MSRHLFRNWSNKNTFTQYWDLGPIAGRCHCPTGHGIGSPDLLWGGGKYFSDFRTVTHDYFDFFLGFDFRFSQTISWIVREPLQDSIQTKHVLWISVSASPNPSSWCMVVWTNALTFGTVKENFEHLASNNKTFTKSQMQTTWTFGRPKSLTSVRCLLLNSYSP